jgi:hypothetical protein
MMRSARHSALGGYLAESILPTRAATLAAIMSDFDHATSRPLESRACMLKGGCAEAGDRGGIVCARLVGLNGRPAIRRECKPGIQLAEALSRRAACAGRPVSSATDPGGGWRRNRMRRPRNQRRGRRRSRLTFAASTVVASAAASMRGHCGACSMCWSGDDPGSLWCAGLACGRTNRYEWLYRSRKRCGAILMQVISTSSEAPEAT